MTTTDTPEALIGADDLQRLADAHRRLDTIARQALAAWAAHDPGAADFLARCDDLTWQLGAEHLTFTGRDRDSDRYDCDLPLQFLHDPQTALARLQDELEAQRRRDEERRELELERRRERERAELSRLLEKYGAPEARA